jgi:cytochrome c oxidase assembly protein subunit 15
MSTTPARPSGAADILTLGFGTAALMWTVGYACRLFGPTVPAPLMFAFLLLALLAGGFIAGRYTTRGVRGGVYTGLLAGTIDLFIVASLIGGKTPHDIKAGALAWIPGTLVVSVALGALGAALGRTRRSPRLEPPDWPGLFAAVGAGTTVVLLAAGGLVTGFDEGLAVVDWPNTEGYNMFFYPLARMTGGVYLEHAHRLLGSLVGLITLVLAFHVQSTDRRRWLKVLTWLALALVIVQGILGGLRVTGRFTLSTRPADTDPKILLAIVHGVFGQIVFAVLVVVAICRSRRFISAAPPVPAPSARTDRAFGCVLLVILVAQLVLGALVRHFSWALDILRYGLPVEPARLIAIGHWALTLHTTVAVLVVLLAVGVGVRAWGLYRHVPLLRRLGCGLLLLAGLQLALGVAALIVTGNNSVLRRPTAPDVALTTAHQVVGAALLACTVMLLVWNYRLLATPPRPFASGPAAEHESSPPRATGRPAR